MLFMDKNFHKFISGGFETQAYPITYISKLFWYSNHNYNKIKSMDKNKVNIISEILMQHLISHAKKDEYTKIIYNAIVYVSN